MSIFTGLKLMILILFKNSLKGELTLVVSEKMLKKRKLIKKKLSTKAKKYLKKI